MFWTKQERKRKEQNKDCVEIYIPHWILNKFARVTRARQSTVQIMHSMWLTKAKASSTWKFILYSYRRNKNTRYARTPIHEHKVDFLKNYDAIHSTHSMRKQYSALAFEADGERRRKKKWDGNVNVWIRATKMGEGTRKYHHIVCNRLFFFAAVSNGTYILCREMRWFACYYVEYWRVTFCLSVGCYTCDRW